MLMIIFLFYTVTAKRTPDFEMNVGSLYDTYKATNCDNRFNPVYFEIIYKGLKLLTSDSAWIIEDKLRRVLPIACPEINQTQMDFYLLEDSSNDLKIVIKITGKIKIKGIKKKVGPCVIVHHLKKFRFG